MAIKVFLVDDQTLITEAFRMLLKNQPGIEVVGDAKNGQIALEMIGQQQSDVVLMDMIMPGMDGVATTREIHQRYPNIKVLILSVDGDQEYVMQAIRCGAAGYILKTTPPEELAFAIHAVYRGYMHLGPGLGEKMLDKIEEILERVSQDQPQKLRDLTLLTPREQEITRVVAQGASNKEIAEQLFISEKTVKNHISHILNRLNLRNRIHLVIWALS